MTCGFGRPPTKNDVGGQRRGGTHHRVYLSCIPSLALAAFALACASGPRASPVASIVRSWDYAADRAAVWDASLSAVRATGFETLEAVKSRGEILTGWRSLEPGAGFATCSSAYEGRLSLHLGEGVQGVRVTMESEYRSEMDRGESCATTGELERELNRLILERLRDWLRKGTTVRDFRAELLANATG